MIIRLFVTLFNDKSLIVKILVIPFLLLFALLQAEEPTKATFESLSSYLTGQEIIIRGFLYKSPNHQWILTSEPNLKSCCVGAFHKATHQITLEGVFAEQDINRVISVRGIWKAHPSYTLLEAKFVASSHSYSIMLSLLLSFITAVAFLTFISKRKRRTSV